MSAIPSELLAGAIGQALLDNGVSDDLFKTDAISAVIQNAVSMIQKTVADLTAKNVATQQKQMDLQQETAKTNDEINKLTKVVKSMTEACLDRSGAQTLPQQDMNAEPEQPATQPEQPAPDAGAVPSDTGMMSPPDMGVAPGPDMGVMPPASDAGMVPPDMGAVSPAPDMMQVDPNMLGALQPRF